MEKVLVINPGSTSTKIAVFDGTEELFSTNVSHSSEDLKAFNSVYDQTDYRTETIEKALKEAGISPDSFDIVMGRGGGARGLEAGGYEVNDDLIYAMTHNPILEHAASLGAPIARNFALKSGCRAYIYDATGARALTEIAAVTGFEGFKKESACHVLNMRAMAMKYAESVAKKFNEINVVVCHFGGGATLCAIKKGVLIDCVRDDAGPMSPTRSGAMNFHDAVDLCYSGKYTYEEMSKRVRGNAGLESLLGTHAVQEVQRRMAEGDEKAKLVYEAMCYQTAKACASLLAVFAEPVDAVILTGGVANSPIFTGYVSDYLKYIANVVILPGEGEMEALCLGGLRLLRGEEQPNPEYRL